MKYASFLILQLVCFTAKCVVQYHAVRFANFEGILAFLFHQSSQQTSYFNPFGFVSGCKGLLLVIVRPVSGYNQLVCFKDFSDLSYSCHLQLKQCLPPFLDKNSTHHCNFLRHSQFCLCRLSWVSAFKHCDLH